MKEIIDFLKYLHEVKFLAFPRIILYEDFSGHIEYDLFVHAESHSEDVEIFSFNSLEELHLKIEEYKKL